MFYNSSNINYNFGSWNLRTAGVDMTGMLDEVYSMSVENYSRTLIGWANYVSANSNTPSSVIFGANASQYNCINYVSGQTYNNAVAARTYLATGTPNWSIADGGQTGAPC
jgi:hypothetical protein